MLIVKRYSWSEMSPNEAIAPVLPRLINDIQRWSRALRVPLSPSTNEATRRQYISCVMLALVEALDRVVLLRIEEDTSGTVGRGPIDYDLLYKLIQILVTEAKKDKDLKQATAQNVAQLVSAQQVL